MPAFVVLGVLLSSRSASADVVPPPPKHCPKGQVGVTSHGGPECVLEAPKNCLPGYRGQLRGQCVLACCSSDDNCDGGRKCLQVDVCQEFRELHWTGWGWGAQRTVTRDNLLAEPPSPPPDGPPKKDWVLINICGQDGACKAPAQCRPTGLCYPPSAVGKTKAKVSSGVMPDPPPASSGSAGAGGAPSTEFATPPDETTATGGGASGGAPGTTGPTVNPEPLGGENGGGCRKGCSTTLGPSALGWLGLPLLAAAALLLRRRRG